MVKKMQEQPILIENPTALFDFSVIADFEEKILSLASEMALILTDYEIDHMAVRVNHCKTAKSYLDLFVKKGRIVSDNLINGRVIYLVELEQPITFLGQKVSIVELPYPKDKIYPREGWEHIEIVIPFLPQESVADWCERIKKQFQLNQLIHLKVKVDEPKADGEKLLNPSIAVSFVDKQQNHTCIKVHPYNIKQIIEVNQ